MLLEEALPSVPSGQRSSATGRLTTNGAIRGQTATL